MEIVEPGPDWTKIRLDAGREGWVLSRLLTDAIPKGIQLEQLQQALKVEKQQSEKRIGDILKKYRSFIYTRYKWTEGMGFKGSKLVTDVYDDGRFTFIRVVADQRGVLAVSAEIDGKQEMIQYNLDSDSIYKISGIYPEFNLQYGKSKVKITRKDNKSNGAY